MKFAEGIFPKGIFNQQQTDGAYLDGTLAANLDVLAKKVVKDMQFTLIISGHDMVGNGKTTLATHLGCYLTNKINELHKFNNSFTHKNMVFGGVDLAERSFELPKHSVIVLDEGDDLTTHGMKESAVKLKRYFRKCRQLNQILILILPSFFELPKFYALSRSQALLDVKFESEFERGYFSFFGMRNKKLLYLKGRREWDYDAQKPDFKGRFFGEYAFFPNTKEETELYKKQKYEDMVEDHIEQNTLTEAQIVARTKREMFSLIYYYFKKNYYRKEVRITQALLAEAMGVTTQTGEEWIKRWKEENCDSPNPKTVATIIGNLDRGEEN